MGNSDTVRKIYAAFGRGEISTILDCLAEDVEWEYGVVSTELPYLQPRRGRSEVRGFFDTLHHLEFHRFEPKQILESGTVAVALIDLEVTVKATGRRIVEEDEAHVWHFDGQGKVRRFRHRVDTHLHVTAWRGE